MVSSGEVELGEDCQCTGEILDMRDWVFIDIIECAVVAARTPVT